MEISCSQMDVLLSFYADGDLSTTLRRKVEEHLNNCSVCRAKYEIIKSMFEEMKLGADIRKNINCEPEENCRQYKFFRNKLSEYIDNELSGDENVKIRKFTINNKQARKELEDNYTIRKLMSDSFNKTKNDMKYDFSGNIVRQLAPEFHNRFIKRSISQIALAFIATVLVLSAIIIFSLSL